MPSRHEALAQSFIEAFNAGDTKRLIALSTPDIEVRPLRAVLEAVVYHGPAGLEQLTPDQRARFMRERRRLLESSWSDEPCDSSIGPTR